MRKVIDKLAFTVVGANGTFRNDSEVFNPTNTAPPFFQVFSDEFLDVLGSNATIRMIAQNETFAFAHEAPIWVPETDQVSTIPLIILDDQTQFRLRFSSHRMMEVHLG